MKRIIKQLHMATISGIFVLMLVVATVVPANATFTEIQVASWDVMYINFEYGSHTGGYAGEITVSLRDDVDGWGDLQAAFCVDLDSDIYKDRTYTIETMLQPAPIEVAWLMDTYSSPTASSVSGAALQSGIWEVLYADKFNLTGPLGVTELYDAYMVALGDATIETDYLLSNYSVVSINGYQNLLVQNSSSAPVPEPTTMLLFGAGLIGLAGVGRKKIK